MDEWTMTRWTDADYQRITEAIPAPLEDWIAEDLPFEGHLCFDRVDEIAGIVDQLRIPNSAPHHGIAEAMILAAWRDAPTKKGGKTILASIKKAGSIIRAFGLSQTGWTPDFILTVCLAEWRTMTIDRKVRLIDHELCHIAGSPGKWALATHDIEDFTAVCARHGLSGDGRRFAAHVKWEQQELDFTSSQFPG